MHNTGLSSDSLFDFQFCFLINFYYGGGVVLLVFPAELFLKIEVILTQESTWDETI